MANWLAFDTSANACSVALSIEGQPFSAHELCPRQQAERLLPTLEHLLRQADSRLEAIDDIAVGVGPGSFMGVRLAVATAQGLALGLRKPLWAVSSLESLALQAIRAHETASQVLVCADARMKEVYWACYSVADSRRPQLLGQECLSSVAEVTIAEADRTVLIGSGVELLRAEIKSAALATVTDEGPQASDVLALAMDSMMTGKALSKACDVLPRYLRDNVTHGS